MHKNNFYISFGVWLVVVTQFGVPGTWIKTLVFISGIFLILVSLGPAILRKLQVKTKPKKKQEKINLQNTPSQNNEQNEELRFSAPENDQVETKAEEEI
jgi:hypothetical protein